jgi:hypothetical protein
MSCVLSLCYGTRFDFLVVDQRERVAHVEPLASACGDEATVKVPVVEIADAELTGKSQ